MFSASLINDPTDDPGVYVDLKYRREALLFDLGDIGPLPPRKILKIKYIFISHTHMDHFIGFDRLLRICLGRDQRISLFGPPDFIGHVQHKLRSYNWNLVENYANDLELSATEVHSTYWETARFSCRNAFRQSNRTRSAPHGQTLVEEDLFSVKGVLLDHSIPSLAFRLEEKTRLNVKKNVLQEMGLPTGPWLVELKSQILQNRPDASPVKVWWKNRRGEREERQLPLGLLREKAVKITAGQTIAYITDAVWNRGNASKMQALAKGAELLFIEAPFLHEDAAVAADKHHLTARQAGLIAARAGVHRICVFHFSPKYKGREDMLHKEARDGFQENKSPHCYGPQTS